MDTTTSRLAGFSILFLRLALGIAFLSAVADRFGWWGPPGASGVAWGNFENFLSYTARLNPYLPGSMIPFLGWVVTLAEIIFGLALIVGFRIRKVAPLSGVVLLAFAIGMIIGDGLKAPLDYSVFTASAASFLLAAQGASPLSLDIWLSERNG